MATSAGELIYTVGMDTAPLMTGAKNAEAAIDGVGGAAASAAAGVGQLGTKMTGTAKAVSQATTSMGSARSAAQQLGYQIQDISVQLQSGTNAMVVFGQQGSQIASLFGPTGAIVGAVLAVAAAIGTSLVSSAKEATQTLAELTDQVDSLTAAQKEYLKISIGESIKEQTWSLNELNQRIATLNYYQELNGSLTDGQARDLAKLKYERDSLAKLMDEERAKIDVLNKSSSVNIKQTKDAEDAYKRLTEQLGLEEVALKNGDRAAAILAATTRLGAGATKEQKDEVTRLINTVYDLQEAKAAQEKAEKEGVSSQKKSASQYAANEQMLKKMAEQLSIAGLSTNGLAREAAELAAEYSLGEGATQQQIEQAKQLAGALFDLNEEKERQKELEKKGKEAEKFVSDVAFDAKSPLEQIDAEESAKLQKLEEYRALDLLSAQQYYDSKTAIAKAAADERAAIELSRNQMILSASSDFFGGMAELTSAFAGEQSGAYKALFAVSKGFAIANAALQLQTAIANASALPWPANFPAIAQAVALGSQIASGIAGVSYGGARQFGGPTDAGKMYRIGENNQPEVFTSGAGSYMISGDRGRVTPMSEVGGGNFQQSVNVHNYGGSSVQTQTSPDGRQMDIIIGEVASQISNRRGAVYRSMQSGTNTRFRSR